MTITALGIDPSISGTGAIILRANGTPRPDLLHEEEFTPRKGSVGIQRSRDIALDVMRLIHTYKPDEIVMEGYSLNTKNRSSIIPLCELGGILRLMLMLDGFKWRDPRAGELKKFVFGKGTAKKEHMMMYVLKRWGHEAKSNNTADAYGLACIGLAARNLLPGVTVDMRVVAGDLPLRAA